MFRNDALAIFSATYSTLLTDFQILYKIVNVYGLLFSLLHSLNYGLHFTQHQ